MKVTRTLRAKMNPEAMLHSPAVKRAAKQVLTVLDRVGEAADRAKVIQTVQRILREGGADRLVSRPLTAVRRELRKVAGETTPRSTNQPMPEVIHAKGGKRIPGSVARRAVKPGTSNFKVKKGKK